MSVGLRRLAITALSLSAAAGLSFALAGAPSAPDTHQPSVDARALYCEDGNVEQTECDSRLDANDVARLTAGASPFVTRAELATVEKSLKAAVLITSGDFLLSAGSGYELLTVSNVVAVSGRAGRYPLCEPNLVLGRQQKFWNQPRGGTCSGFLVTPNRVATAGHCISSNDLTGSRLRIVFNFRQEGSAPRKKFATNEVYRVRRVIKRSMPPEPDFAVLELDGDVPQSVASPLDLAAGNAADREGEIVGLMGHPNGIPLKISLARKNKVLTTTPTTFIAGLDAFQGNSGSAVLLKTALGTAGGILVSGRGDYLYAEEQGAGCALYATYASSDGGETATDISVVRPYIE